MVTFVMFKSYELLHYKEILAINWMTLVVIRKLIHCTEISNLYLISKNGYSYVNRDESGNRISGTRHYSARKCLHESISRQYFFVLKMPLAFYVYCIYSNALQTAFDHGSKYENPYQTAPQESSLI